MGCCNDVEFKIYEEENIFYVNWILLKNWEGILCVNIEGKVVL